MDPRHSQGRLAWEVLAPGFSHNFALTIVGIGGMEQQRRELPVHLPIFLLLFSSVSPKRKENRYKPTTLIQGQGTPRPSALVSSVKLMKKCHWVKLARQLRVPLAHSPLQPAASLHLQASLPPPGRLRALLVMARQGLTTPIL